MPEHPVVKHSLRGNILSLESQDVVLAVFKMFREFVEQAVLQSPVLVLDKLLVTRLTVRDQEFNL